MVNGEGIGSIGGGVEMSMSLTEVGFDEGSEIAAGSDEGFTDGRGVVVVVAVLMWCSISVGTVFGVTFSMMVKEGRRRMVVRSEYEWWSSGVGILEAESINFPLLGSTPQSLTASMTLPFSSDTSRTQSVFPVATSI